MNFSIGKLLGYAASPEGAGWSTSAAVHVAGALVAWATCSTLLSLEPPRLPGDADRAELLVTWAELPRPPVVEIVPPEPRVVVMPDRVQIADRTFSPASTDVSRPTPSELAMAERIIAIPPSAVSRRLASEEVSRPPDSGAPPTSAISRRPKAAEISAAQAKITIPPRQPAAADVLTPPRLLDNRPPTYPAQALAGGIEGTVLLRLRIAADGRVSKVEIIDSSDHLILDAAAVRAVRTWRFVPARRAGAPVATTVRLPVRFAL